jgi:hypothetical protein
MWWPDLSLFYVGCTLKHILQNNTIKRFLAIFWRLTFFGHILTRLISTFSHGPNHMCVLKKKNLLLQNQPASFNQTWVKGNFKLYK